MTEEEKSGQTRETFNSRAALDSVTTEKLLNLKVLIIGMRGVILHETHS